MKTSQNALNIETIKSNLDDAARRRFKSIVVFDEIGSTNDYLLDYSKTSYDSSNITVAIADKQTKGRGREGRPWLSIPKKSILMSLLWQIEEKKLSSIQGLSLAIGISIAKALSELSFNNIKVKWPNDLFYNKEKLGGILIENRFDSEKKIHNIVIGFGINVKFEQTISDTLKHNIASLEKITKENFSLSRNQIIATILNNLNHDLDIFAKQGFDPFYKIWPKWDALLEHNVVHSNTLAENELTHGKAVGIDQNGALLVETKDNKTLSFSAGSVSFDE